MVYKVKKNCFQSFIYFQLLFQDGNPPYQDVIEGCFQKEIEEYVFHHGNQMYKLRLQREMLKQINIVYGTERQVRRRPIMVEKVHIKQKNV